MLISFLFVCGNLCAQRYEALPSLPQRVHWTEYIAPAGTAFVSGLVEGINQTLLWHYDRFEHRHPGADAEWWDPRRSYGNKWALKENGKPDTGRERFFLSSTALAWTTDGYHLSGTADWWMVSATIVLHPSHVRRPLWRRAVEVLGYGICRKAGFHLVYSVYYK